MKLGTWDVPGGQSLSACSSAVSAVFIECNVADGGHIQGGHVDCPQLALINFSFLCVVHKYVTFTTALTNA